MHTATCGKTNFNFNSDLSGDVVITNDAGTTIMVPGGDLVAFVAEYVRQQRIAEIENMTALEVLDLKRGP